jgi:hypothetical protein
MFQRGIVNIYAGGRTKFSKALLKGFHTYNGISSEEKYIHFSIGPALGFEYFVSNHLSFGGEMGLAYSYSNAKLDRRIPDMDNEESTSHLINFNSGVFFRIFF